MKKPNTLLTLLMMSAALTTGCTVRTADVTLCSTKNIYVKGVDVTKLPQKPGVQAEGDWKFSAVWPGGPSRPSRPSRLRTG